MILNRLKETWTSIQEAIPFRPHYHVPNFSTTWPAPIQVQFITKETLLINFEDDDTSNTAVLQFDGRNLMVRETFEGKSSFARAEWLSLIRRYGGMQNNVSTYTKTLIRNRKTLNFKDYTAVPENVFLEEY